MSQAVLPLLTGLVLAGFPASAQPAGWAELRDIQLQNAGGVDLIDYQVPLTLDTKALITLGQLRADGADLRFAADCGATELTYWMDEATLNTETTRVWVKVPLLPAGVSTGIQMYYGNSGATAASSLSAFAGPSSATNQVSGYQTGGVTTSSRGFRFTPNVPVFVTEFGKNEPNGTTRYVTLWDGSSQTQILQAQVAGPAASWSYLALPATISLEAGHQYLLQLYQDSADGYYFGAPGQLNSALTYHDMRYCNGCTQDTFPTNFLNNILYGYPDFTFYAAAARATPEVAATVSTTEGCVESATCNASCLPSSCGDTVINATAGEQCDDGNEVDTDACRNDCQLASCGDGVVQDEVDQCDDGNTDDTDACRNNCQIAICGDGAVQAGVEPCDDGNGDDTDACLNNCNLAACGDGVVYAGMEQCDDGNGVDTDGCRNSCAAASCGDMVVQESVEQCDDGDADDTDHCLSNCNFAVCGDGVIRAGVEECEDSNTTNTDACLNTCRHAVCGDGAVQTGVEGCDDGNSTETDACHNDCSLAVCGDGVTQIGTEECDDADTEDTDGCRNDCTIARCGDGVVESGREACDDGNVVNTDACSNGCELPTCGDGIIQAGVEPCDDGNTVDADACRNDCSLPVCGDGLVAVGIEQCDDGNTADGDGCSARCGTEPAVIEDPTVSGCGCQSSSPGAVLAPMALLALLAFGRAGRGRGRSEG